MILYLLISLIILAVGLVGLWKIKNTRKKSNYRQCSYGDSSVQAILEQGSDYRPLKNRIEAAKTFEERYFVSVAISREYPLKTLKRWVRKEPDSADALICCAARMLQWSWSARGDGNGDTISEKKWELFFDRLTQTREVLLQSAEMLPSDPTPWAYLTLVSTWTSDSDATKRSYFEQAILRDPTNWAAHMYMVIGLSEKWGGDDDAMLEFAQQVCDDAPEGSDLPIILIKAYIEYWKYLDAFDDSEVEAIEFIENQSIRDNAVAAYERSLAHSEHTDTAVSTFARYNASSWFWLVQDQLRLKQELGVLSNKIEDIHWRWTGTEGELGAAREFANASPTS